MPRLEGPIGALIVVPVLTLVTYSSAVKSAAGEPLEVSGRRQTLKQLIVSAGESLGPTGCLVVGGVATILAIIWLVVTVRVRQKMTAAAEGVPSNATE